MIDEGPEVWKRHLWIDDHRSLDGLGSASALGP
jgi:hypothetical protein